MPNPTLELIQRHGSVRNYRPDPIPVETIEAIVAAAQRTSTSSNMQAYSVVAVSDAAETRPAGRAVRQPGAHRPGAGLPRLVRRPGPARPRLRAARLCPGNRLRRELPDRRRGCGHRRAERRAGRRITGAGHLLHRQHPQQHPGSDRSAGAAAAGFPGHRHDGGLARGRATPSVPGCRSLRCCTGNTTPSEHDAELAEYDRAMAATGIYGGRQVPVPGKPEEMEDYGWTEHTARRVAQAVRTDLREVLERQGFALK